MKLPKTRKNCGAVRFLLVILAAGVLLAGCGKKNKNAAAPGGGDTASYGVVEKIPDVRTHALYPLIDKCFYASSERISETITDGGFEILFKNTASDPETVHSLTVRETEPLPLLHSEAEYRDHFEKQYPDLKRYSVYEKARHILTEDASVLYCRTDGKEYTITSSPAENGSFSDAVRFAGGFGTDELCVYKKFANGDFSWDDMKDGELLFRRDLCVPGGQGAGGSEILQLFVRETGKTEADTAENQDPENVLEVSVYRGDQAVPGEGMHKQEKPLQTFEVTTAARKFIFEDFNCDGFEDLTVVRQETASSRTAAHYLWIPGEQCFRRAPEKLEEYDGYETDPDAGILHLFRQTSILDSEGEYIRWTGAEEYEVLSRYRYCLSDDRSGLEFEILLQADGLSYQKTCVYDYDFAQLYMEEIRRLAEPALKWTGEITPAGAGKPCRLVYNEKDLTVGGHPAGKAKTGVLYLLDPEGRYMHSIRLTSLSPCSGWHTEKTADASAVLVLEYEDGQKIRLTERELAGTVSEEEEEQLRVFADHAAQWADRHKEAGLYYFYAVTDFDRDGQLEMSVVCLDSNGRAVSASLTEAGRETGESGFVSFSWEADQEGIQDITELGSSLLIRGKEPDTPVWLFCGNRYTSDNLEHTYPITAVTFQEERVSQHTAAERFVLTDDRGYDTVDDTLFTPEQIAAAEAVGGSYQICWYTDFVWNEGGPLEIEQLEPEKRTALLRRLYRGWGVYPFS